MDKIKSLSSETVDTDVGQKEKAANTNSERMGVLMFRFESVLRSRGLLPI